MVDDVLEDDESSPETSDGPRYTAEELGLESDYDGSATLAPSESARKLTELSSEYQEIASQARKRSEESAELLERIREYEEEESDLDEEFGGKVKEALSFLPGVEEPDPKLDAVNELQARYDLIQAHQHELDRITGKLETYIERQGDEIRGYLEEIKEKREQYEELEDEVAELQEQYEQAQQELEELEGTSSAAADVELEIHDLETELNRKQDRMSNLHREVSRLEQAYEDEKQRIQVARETKDTGEEYVDILEDQQDHMQSTIDHISYTQTAATESAEIAELVQDTREITSELAVTQAKTAKELKRATPILEESLVTDEAQNEVEELLGEMEEIDEERQVEAFNQVHSEE